ncbi:hypothetical protein C5C17_11910 [Pseudoclavibacter sp. RFBA6]|nr:hypothetical protein C5C17_11910 [Pseudoclavibacter sp. RFBA6]
MKCGTWEHDPDFSGEPPDDAQMTSGQKLVAGIEWFADKGTPRPSYCTVNYLVDGVWEFKLGAVRVSFYDTDGSGGYEPKARIDDISTVEKPDDYWQIPVFDEQIRLGHCFPKNSQKTPEADLVGVVMVRREDLEHDRES